MKPDQKTVNSKRRTRFIFRPGRDPRPGRISSLSLGQEVPFRRSQFYDLKYVPAAFGLVLHRQVKQAPGIQGRGIGIKAR